MTSNQAEKKIQQKTWLVDQPRTKAEKDRKTYRNFWQQKKISCAGPSKCAEVKINPKRITFCQNSLSIVYICRRFHFVQMAQKSRKYKISFVTFLSCFFWAGGGEGSQLPYLGVVGLPL